MATGGLGTEDWGLRTGDLRLEGCDRQIVTCLTVLPQESRKRAKSAVAMVKVTVLMFG